MPQRDLTPLQKQTPHYHYLALFVHQLKKYGVRGTTTQSNNDSTETSPPIQMGNIKRRRVLNFNLILFVLPQNIISFPAFLIGKHEK